MNGYSITGLPLKISADKRVISDIEYHAVTLCEKGVMKAVNPRTREVALISKSEKDEESTGNTEVTNITKQAAHQHHIEPKKDLSVEEILLKHGFGKANKDKQPPFL
jgi:hypothetical protein